MFSKTSKYAIKAVLFLALHTTEKRKVAVKEIAKYINVPQPYMAKILQELSRQNIISSVRGPKGGFYLSDENKNQPLMQIISAIEGHQKVYECALSLEECNKNKPCPIHNLIVESKEKLLENLKTKTILDLAEKVKNGEAYLPD